MAEVACCVLGFNLQYLGNDNEDMGEPSKSTYKLMVPSLTCTVISHTLQVSGFSQSTKDEELKRYLISSVSIPFDFTQV